MHRCFQIPEIVSMFVNELDSLPDADLLAVSLISKLFQEPALDALWETLFDLRQLVGCLPPDIWTEDIYFDRNFSPGELLTVRILDFSQAPTAQDLKRYLEFYAPRIRTVSLMIFTGDRGFTFFSTRAFQLLQLATNFRLGSLSPRAQHIFDWLPDIVKEDHADSYPFISLFLSPEVRSLNFDYDSSKLEPIENATIRYALHQSPCMETVYLRDNVGFSTQCDLSVIEEWFQSAAWPHLKTIVIRGQISPRSLECFSTLPNLKSLDCHCKELGATQPLSSYPLFKSLTVLHFTTDNIEIITALFLRVPSDNRLQDVDLGSCHASTTLQAKALFSSIFSKLKPEFLEELAIEECTCHSGFDQQLQVGHRIDVSPALSFPRLRLLQIRTQHALNLTLDLARKVPVAWPNLDVLALREGPNIFPPSIDHSFLLAISGSHSCCRSLSIRFDATRVTEDVQSLHGKEPSHPFHLCVHFSSPISSTDNVLELLKAAFKKSMVFRMEGARSLGSDDRHDFSAQWRVVEQRWKMYIEDESEA